MRHIQTTAKERVILYLHLSHGCHFLKSTLLFAWNIDIKGSRTRDFQQQVFFHESVPALPLKNLLEPFLIFIKIGGYICM
jgi:hypothetical protein